MPRARSPQDYRQTAAAYETEGSGCLSGYVLPPLAVLFVSVLLTVLGMHTPVQAIRMPSPMPPTDAPLQAARPSPTAFQPEALFVRQLPATSLPTEAPAIAAELPAPFVAPQSSVGATQAPPPPDAPLPFVATSTGLAPLFTPEVQHWAASIQEWASAASVDANLAGVVMQIESCGDPRAVSRSGAIGLFQVMPFHFYVLDDPFDPDTNAKRGMDYLRRSLEAAGGEARLALAGYNGGIGVIDRGEWTWSAETTRYVYWGEGIYADAIENASESARLQEWFTTAGAGLCRQAHQRLGLNP